MRLFPPRQRARTAGQLWEHVTVEKRRGRVETRRLRATALLNDYLDWPGVAQVCCVEREVKAPGKAPSREVAYAITSVPAGCAGPSTLLGWWRGHWGIEIPQSEDPRGDNLCAAGRAGYHRRGIPARSGRVVRPATGPRSQLMFAEEFNHVPPRARLSRRSD